MADYAVLQAELLEADAELWDLWCIELGADGSEWIDQTEVPVGAPGSPPAPPREVPPPQGTVRIRHYFTKFPPGTPGEWIADYRARFPQCAAPAQVTWSQRQDEAWSTQWHQYFAPLRVGERFLICPPWQDADGAASEPRHTERLRIVIEPGQGFGTGRHASTALALCLLESVFGEESSQTPPQRCLDVGTGSGILLIAARLLGAADGWACDIDARVAPEVRNNLRLSGLGSSVRLTIGTPAALRDEFPLVIANITAPVLLDFAPDLRRLTSRGGHLILSGMLIDEIAAVLHALLSEGWCLKRQLETEGWAAAWLMREQR